MKIAFLDMSCPKPYSANTLKKEGLGGTEASVVRVAEELAKRGHTVKVVQHNRKTSVGKRVKYVPITRLTLFKPHVVVVLRSAKPLAFLQKNLKHSKLFLWLHDLEQPGQTQFAEAAPLLNDVKPRIVCVSRTHKSDVIDTIRYCDPDPKYTVTHIYNPIDDSLQPDATACDKNKLLFLSSPHKNLQNAVKMFSYINEKYPLTRLYVANPGYLADAKDLPPNVISLGKLRHRDVIKHLREALCLFYPNPDWFTRETYGIVVAEALAVGTPALVHNIGALHEIVNDRDMFVDGRDVKSVTKQFQKWYQKGKPKASLTLDTRTSSVVDRWEEEFRKALK